MRQPVNEEYREIIQGFYRIYRQMQKKYNLHMHTHFSLYEEGLIEIWTYEGGVRKRYICKLKEENEADCYRKAIRELERYRETGKETEYAEKVG